jgi:ABC-type glycerol-3-phosphate transport system substrate-binding protein
MYKRRRLLAAWSAGAASLLAGCLTRPAGAPARPGPAATVPTLVLAPYGWSKEPVVQRILQETVARFEQAQQGRVRVQVVPGNGCCNPGADIAGIVAAAQPDVFTDNSFGAFRGGDYLLPLDPYLQRDNIDQTIWSRQQLASFRTPRGLYALPVYFNIEAYMVNLTAFDDAGLPYPDPGWTHADFTRAARAVTSDAGGRHRYGCGLDWNVAAGGQASFDWVLRGFGGRLVDEAGMRCLLAEPPAVAAGRWVYEELVWPGVGVLTAPGGGPSFATGGAVLATATTCCILGVLQQIRGAFQWDFYPTPLMPKGRTTFGGSQFWAIPRTCPRPDLAWELLKWLAVDPTYQRVLMQIQLASPALNALWDEWEATITAIAPPLQGKALHWFADAARQGYAYTFPSFAAGHLQAMSALAGALGPVAARRQSVEQGFAQAAAQANAAVAAATTMTAAVQAKAQAFPTQGPAVAPVPSGI